jgi:hypothetical protein
MMHLLSICASLALLLGTEAVGAATYFVGPLATRLRPPEIAAIGQASGADTAAPIAVFGERSQALPETWYADVFLPPTTVTARLRRGPVIHLQCIPNSDAGGCVDWRIIGPQTQYAQLVDRPRGVTAAALGIQCGTIYPS